MSWEFLADEKAGEEAVRITGTIVSMGSGEVLEVIFALQEISCMQKASLSPMLKSWGLPPPQLPSSDTNARNPHSHLVHNSPPSDENVPTARYTGSSDFRLSNEDIWCGLEPKGKVGRPPKDKVSIMIPTIRPAGKDGKEVLPGYLGSRLLARFNGLLIKVPILRHRHTRWASMVYISTHSKCFEQ
ncbi:hypothetical protein PILCRDRAFT_651176 [Piloderma croceum F 1598]|uniref:Uncharacterized protein n=1 Tax=Piloderma croceum (strain F 1598) TaxID=765440 RepID=A0A0C3F8S0_PILCF|nr:hypothetical protein PILCRDRAFT_651176 [Piloderma croceum F 1598]